MTPKVQRRCTKESWWPPLYTAGIAAVRRARARQFNRTGVFHVSNIYLPPPQSISFFLFDFSFHWRGQPTRPWRSQTIRNDFTNVFIGENLFDSLSHSPHAGGSTATVNWFLDLWLKSYSAGFYSTLMICNKFVSLSRIESLGTNISINPSE